MHGFQDDDDTNDQLRKMTRELSRAKREDKSVLAKNEGEARDALHRMVQGTQDEGTLSGAQMAVDQNFKRKTAEWMTIIRAKYQGVVIRRTVKSLDYANRPISGLEPYEEHICMLKLHLHEYDALEKLAQNALDKESFAQRFSSEVSEVIQFYQLITNADSLSELLFGHKAVPVAPMLREGHGFLNLGGLRPLQSSSLMQTRIARGDSAPPSGRRWRPWCATQSRKEAGLNVLHSHVAMDAARDRTFFLTGGGGVATASTY